MSGHPLDYAPDDLDRPFGTEIAVEHQRVVHGRQGCFEIMLFDENGQHVLARARRHRPHRDAAPAQRIERPACNPRFQSNVMADQSNHTRRTDIGNDHLGGVRRLASQVGRHM